MKNILVVFTLFTVLACTATNKKTMVASTYDSKADIDLFLSTGEESVENQVLDRLKLHNVDSVQIKQILRATLSESSQNSRGLQSNLKLKIKQKKLSYALYVPDLV